MPHIIQILISNVIDEKSEKSRYFPNPDADINKNIILGFDYYRRARYSLVSLGGLVIFDNYDNPLIKYLIIDNTKERHLIYLRSLHFDNKHLLLEKDNGYVLINSDEDILAALETHQLDYYKRLFGESPDTFEEFLSKQIIEGR